MKASLSRRYARALIKLATEEGLLERFGQEIDRLGALVQSDPTWVNVLSDELLSHSGREAALVEIANRLGLHPELRNFLLIVLKKERFSFLPAMIREFGRYRDEILGIVRVTVAEPKMPSSEVIQKVEAVLSQKLKKKVIATGEARPQMIGGILLKVGHVIYDGSIQRELEHMKEALMKG